MCRFKQCFQNNALCQGFVVIPWPLNIVISFMRMDSNIDTISACRSHRICKYTYVHLYRLNSMSKGSNNTNQMHLFQTSFGNGSKTNTVIMHCMFCFQIRFPVMGCMHQNPTILLYAQCACCLHCIPWNVPTVCFIYTFRCYFITLKKKMWLAFDSGLFSWY